MCALDFVIPSGKDVDQNNGGDDVTWEADHSSCEDSGNSNFEPEAEVYVVSSVTSMR